MLNETSNKSTKKGISKEESSSDFVKFSCGALKKHLNRMK